MRPTIGRIVHYRLTADEAAAINKRRADARTERSLAKAEGGAVIHVGNTAHAGDVVALLVTDTHGADCVNGQAFLDGNDSLWVTSTTYGIGPGEWTWPQRVEDEAERTYREEAPDGAD